MGRERWCSCVDSRLQVDRWAQAAEIEDWGNSRQGSWGNREEEQAHEREEGGGGGGGIRGYDGMEENLRSVVVGWGISEMEEDRKSGNREGSEWKVSVRRSEDGWENGEAEEFAGKREMEEKVVERVNGKPEKRSWGWPEVEMEVEMMAVRRSGGGGGLRTAASR